MENDGSALNQNQVIGLTNTLSDPRDVVVCAAGSMPGDLHKLWRTRDRKGYHVEYGYSCMGYEVAGGIGVRMASPDRDVFVMVGDGSYLMMATELVTAVQEGVKVILVLVQNHGFASIGSLSESLGSQRFGTSYRYRDDSGRLAGDKLPVDLAANAASLGAEVIKVTTAAEFTDAVKVAKANEHATVIHVETDPLIYAPDSQSWWDVPVSQTSALDIHAGGVRNLRRVEEDPAPVRNALRLKGLISEHHSRRLRARLLGRLVSRRPGPTPYTRFLDEVADSGYEWIELGPFGYLPTDPEKLSDELASRDLQLSAGTVFEHLHQDDSWDAVWSQIEDVARLTAAVGGKHVVVIPEMWRDPATGAVLEDRDLTAEQWRKKTHGMNELGKAMFEKYGVRAQYHPHADSHVDTEENVYRFLDGTDGEFVNLCLDTGHISYCGGDNIAIIERAPDRIGYLHLKQVDPEVRAKVEAEDLPFGEAVRLGAMTEPPRGIPEMPPLLAAIERLGIDVFAIVEQDMYPCEVDAPLPIAKRTRQYLGSCGVPSVKFA